MHNAYSRDCMVGGHASMTRKAPAVDVALRARARARVTRLWCYVTFIPTTCHGKTCTLARQWVREADLLNVCDACVSTWCRLAVQSISKWTNILYFVARQTAHMRMTQVRTHSKCVTVHMVMMVTWGQPIRRSQIERCNALTNSVSHLIAARAGSSGIACRKMLTSLTLFLPKLC